MTEFNLEISNVLRDELLPMLERTIIGYRIRVVGWSIVISNHDGSDIVSIRVYPDQKEIILIDKGSLATFKYEYGDPDNFEKIVQKVKDIVNP